MSNHVKINENPLLPLVAFVVVIIGVMVVIIVVAIVAIIVIVIGVSLYSSSCCIPHGHCRKCRHVWAIGLIGPKTDKIDYGNGPFGTISGIATDGRIMSPRNGSRFARLLVFIRNLKFFEFRDPGKFLNRHPQNACRKQAHLDPQFLTCKFLNMSFNRRSG